MRSNVFGPGGNWRIAAWAVLIAGCFFVSHVIAQSESPLNDDVPVFEQSGLQGTAHEFSVEPLEPTAPTPGFTPSNVNVSNLDGNESEVSIAVNPTNPMNMVIHGHGPSFGHVNTFSTMDGGQTWTRVPLGDAYDGEDGTGCGRVDPTVTFDDNGICYISYFTAGCDNGRRVLFVARSDDGGLTYNPPTVVADHNDGRVDKEIIGAGPDPNNPGQQNVYLAYRLDVGSDAQIHVATSTDGGQTFSDVIINDESISGNDFSTFGAPTVGDDGEVYVVWDDQSNRPVSSEIMVDVSFDGGLTWGTDVSIGTTAVARGNLNRYDITAQPDRGVLAAPSIATDRSGGPNNGRVYVAYTVVGGGGFDDTDVVLRYSDDDVQTWSPALTVNDDGGSGSQFLPWVTVDNCNDGKVAVAWLDTRNDPNDEKVQAFLGVSKDGGLTIEPNLQIASGQSDQSLSNPQRTVNNYLEYMGVGACNDVACLVWPDNSVDAADLDYFSDCACLSDVVLTCPADITVECTTSGGTLSDHPDIVAFLNGVSGSGCGGNFDITNDAPSVFLEGTTTVTFTATDISGNEATCAANVTVQDTESPEMIVHLSRHVLWPPNHKMVDIYAKVVILDVCDPLPYWELYNITSNEPDNGKGDGDTDGDIEADLLTPTHHFGLRSERSGKGDGRVYTIVYRAEDASSNVVFDTSYVVVPHDWSAGASSAMGYDDTGTGFAPGTREFSVVVLSHKAEYQTIKNRKILTKPELQAALIDPSDANIGNTAGVAYASDSRTIDVNGDGMIDLLLTYMVDPVMAIKSASEAITADMIAGGTISDGPVGLHLFGSDGTPYLVNDIFALGAPAVRDLEDDGGNREPNPGPSTLTANGETPRHFDNGIASIYPNPFNPRTTIRFTLADAGNVTVTIYDVNGALVRKLVDNTLPSGEHTAEWDGTDAQGRSVATGVYFTRMVTADYETTRKMVLVK